ncbi:MAG: hypothetical protein SVS15_07985 [Thermodesulfobacteriota bacterium]|nr:hypothetical protein [Thermodesulfobacteriota bacterium]
MRTSQGSRILLIVLCLGLGLILFPGPRDARAESEESKPNAAIERTRPETAVALNTLKAILRSMDAVQNQIQAKDKEFQAAKTKNQKTRIENQRNELTAHLEVLRKNFEEIATGVDMEKFTERPREDFEWTKEVQDILGPILHEIKGMTARPREMEKLRSEEAYFKERIPITDNAAQAVQELADKTKDQKLQDRLAELKQTWLDRKQELLSRLAVVQYQLDKKLQEKKSLVESAQNLLRGFFKTRGKNIALSLLTLVFVLILLRFLHRIIHRISPVHKSEKYQLYVRLFDVAYEVLTIAGAVGASLLVLYVSGDWVLLAVAGILLFGVAWTARHSLPRFWDQIKLLTNFGTVRKDERVVYNGLPWRVGPINLFTYLKNPELTGGTLRLPLKELLDLRSRPFRPGEPWFPCKKDDWVILADETWGKVINQTPELVQLLLLGGSRKTYPAPDFLQQNPTNLSTGFRLKVTFGIDYQHQALSTHDIPNTLEQMLVSELTRQGYGDELTGLSVEFKEAGASSLDLEILADFSGRAAPDYMRLSRAIPAIAVDACNKYGWVIPFTQITLHTADPAPEKTS